jgi:HEAT repeat protein
MGGLAPVAQVPFVQALARLGPETDGALDALLALAAHGTDDVAMAARMALASAAWGRAVRESGVADTEDPAIRAAAVASVGAAVDASTIPWLIPRTKDPDGGVRMAATAALIPFAWEGTNEPLEPHLDALCALLGDPEPGVRHNIAQLLGQLGGDAVDRLLALVEHDRTEIREAALLALAASEAVRADALSVLQDALGDAALRVRLAAVAPYLRHQGKPEDALVVIEEGLLDTHPDAVPRQTALMILWTTGLEPKTHGPVTALLEDAHEEVRVLAALVLVRDEEADERATEIVEAVKGDPTHPLHGLTLRGR